MYSPKPWWKTILVFILTLFVLQPLELQAQRRPDIYSFSATERLELRNLMMAYITTPVVNKHLVPDPVIGSFHNYREEFLTWHRVYIGDLENYLLAQPGGDKFVPLPSWNPITVIPDEFFNDVASPGVSSVASGWTFSTLTNQDPVDVSFVSLFSNLCSFVPSAGRTAIDNFAQDLEGRHDSVHGNIGGIMGSFQSPAAAIFWLWHAWVDDVYRQYECDCQAIDANDLYTKDSAEDVGYEANDETTGAFYNSVDIWVRNNQDVLLSSGRYTEEDNPLRHQNPEYRAVGGPNYVYVKVRNWGCTTMAAGSANLRVYWSKASTGLNWPTHFNNYLFNSVLHGDEITFGAPVAIPALAPGASFVAEIPWSPPNPADFTFDNQHFCLLSRIESTLDPMTFAEGSSVYANTRNNNNIAWKNLTVVDLDPFNLVAEGFSKAPVFFVRQTFDFAAPLKLVFRSPNQQLRQNLRIELDEKLLGAILQGDQLKGVRIDEDANANQFLVLLDNVAEIGNLRLPPEEVFAIRLNFDLQCAEGEACFQYGDRFDFAVEQFLQGDFADEFIGGNLYDIRIQRDEASNCTGVPTIDFTAKNATCANSSDGAIALKLQGEEPLSIFWSNGRKGSEIGDLAPGEYQVVVRDAKNCINSETIKITDDSDLSLSFQPTQTTRGCDKLASITLTPAGGQPEYSVLWSTGADDFFIDNLPTGMYYVTLTDAAQCQRVDSVSVNQNFPLRTNTLEVMPASSSTANDGQISLLASGGAKPLSYAWSNGENDTALVDLAVGDYIVTITDQLGCSLLDTVRVDFVSAIREIPKTGFIKMAPNPVNNLLRLDFSAFASLPLIGQISVFSADGKLVDQFTLNRITDAFSFDVKHLPAGIYHILLKANDKLFTDRFIKE